jgi:phosphoribosylformylglycinamidine synthase
VFVKVEQTDTPFTRLADKGQVLRLPIAHGEGNYFAEPDVLARLEAGRQVIFRYTDPQGAIDAAWNPNGSLNAIAGIANARRNVVGLMPHPERACEASLGSADGRVVLGSAVSVLAGQVAAQA